MLPNVNAVLPYEDTAPTRKSASPQAGATNGRFAQEESGTARYNAVHVCPYAVRGPWKQSLPSLTVTVRCAGGHRSSVGLRHSEHSAHTSTQPPDDSHRAVWGWKQTIV